MMDRRTVLRRVGIGSVIGLAGCTGNKHAELVVGHYSSGYEMYQSAEGTAQSAVQADGERQRTLGEDAGNQMQEAELCFYKGAQLAEDEQAQTYCSQAKEKARFKRAVFGRFASDEDREPVDRSDEASEYRLADVSEVREAVNSGFI